MKKNQIQTAQKASKEEGVLWDRVKICSRLKGPLYSKKIPPGWQKYWDNCPQFRKAFATIYIAGSCRTDTWQECWENSVKVRKALVTIFNAGVNYGFKARDNLTKK